MTPVFYLQPSRFSILLFTLIYGILLLIICYLPLPVELSAILSLLCVINFIQVLRQQAYRVTATAIQRFWQTNANFWCLEDKQGQVYTAKLCNDSIRTRFIIVLNFAVPHKWFVKSLVLLPDSLDSNSFRRLRTKLGFQF